MVILKNVTAQCTELFNISNHNEKIFAGCGDTEIVMIIGRIWLDFCNVYSRDIIPHGFPRKRKKYYCI